MLPNIISERHVNHNAMLNLTTNIISGLKSQRLSNIIADLNHNALLPNIISELNHNAMLPNMNLITNALLPNIISELNHNAISVAKYNL